MIEDTFIHTTPTDPLIEPIIDGLFQEYRDRYGDYFGEQEEEPLDLYAPPHGAFIVLLRHETPIAMGAFKRYNVTTAELKRIWTHRSMRRQGLAQRVLAELERLAALQGYESVFLTTGFRQPEAVRLYLSHGYQPQFDNSVDPERYSQPPFDGRLPFTKTLLRQPVKRSA